MTKGMRFIQIEAAKRNGKVEKGAVNCLKDFRQVEKDEEG